MAQQKHKRGKSKGNIRRAGQRFFEVDSDERLCSGVQRGLDRKGFVDETAVFLDVI